MTLRTRKRLALFVLVVGIPAYLVLATTIVGLIERPPLLVELGIYLGLGLAWAFPLKGLFLGIAKAPPEDADQPPRSRE